MYYFTSNTHFNGELAFKLSHRPFSCMKEHDDTIIANINKTVSKDDVLYCIGDFTSFNSKLTAAWVKGLETVKRINCSVVLVMGCAEWKIVNNMFAGDFSMFRHYCIKLGFADVVEEMRTHRHFHRFVAPYAAERSVNVSVDLNHFLPVSEDGINRIVKGDFKYEDRNN